MPPDLPLAGTAPAAEEDNMIAFYEQRADSLPTPLETVNGIRHKNLSPETLQEPVQAYASRKTHYLKKLEDLMERPDLPFVKRFPNLQFSNQNLEGRPRPRVLDDRAKQWYMKNMGIDKDMKTYVKHILNWHDGEVRLLGTPGWTKFPAGYKVGPGGFTVFHPNFWHYQYMENKQARDWLRWRRTSSWKEYDLSNEWVEWILNVHDNETSYLKYVPGAAGRQGTFYYKNGKLVTLAEMFYFGIKKYTCFAIYQTYLQLPIFAQKRAHSSSGSEQGMHRKAAKKLRFSETGKWGLPRKPRHWY